MSPVTVRFSNVPTEVMLPCALAVTLVASATSLTLAPLIAVNPEPLAVITPAPKFKLVPVATPIFGVTNVNPSLT